jgi:HlyD family secretion protein
MKLLPAAPTIVAKAASFDAKPAKLAALPTSVAKAAGFGARSRIPTICLLAVLAAGCSKPPTRPPISVEPHVQLAKPEKRTIERSVSQPSFVYAYEQTSLYPKVSGYIERWNVDIGDRIKKDQVLCQLYAPELVAEHEEKVAEVAYDQVQVKVAERTVEVANSYWKAAAAQVKEASAQVNKYQASVDRWQSEVKRLTGLAKEKVIDPQVLDESRKQLQADIASREAAQAGTAAAQATELARKADLDKAEADLHAARARVKVATASEQRLAALVGYLRITAPYEGVVVVRNANTGDFVQPNVGDESGPHGTPIYVVARMDKIRVYVDVPEMDAAYVSVGTQATVRLPSFNHAEIAGSVTRTSWALRTKARTLRAEVDLPNPDANLLPGTYAIGKLILERRNVQALPLASVIEIGNQNCCYLYENGKAVLTPVQTGIHDGKWVEVVHKRVKDQWSPFSGQEQVIIGDLSELSDGEPVQVISGNPQKPQQP